MILTGLEFLYFTAFVFAVYWLLASRTALQNAWLLLMSYLFYVSWDWRLLGLVLVGTAIDFTVTRKLSEPSTESGTRRRLLALSLTWNLGALAFFKYEGFFADSLNTLAHAVGIPEVLPHLHLALPIGISFYTLQRLSFVIDVYWRRFDFRPTLLEFALFSCYFPQLTAGPISRGPELLPQLRERRTLTVAALRTAAIEILLGFALKAWAATNLGSLLVDPVYAAPGSAGVVAHVLALVGYPLQVFADFAGYSLMAIGVSRLFGIVLPINFDFPFLSTSLPEFWRRWHITLNRWLFDYIFTPLTTGQGWFRGRFAAALMLTFLASGLWHGASWTFILWGFMHGVGMVVHRWWDDYYRGLCRADRSWVAVRKGLPYRFAAWAITMTFFALSLIPFRATSLGDASAFVGGLLGRGSGGPGIGLEVNLLVALPFLVAFTLAGTQFGRRWVERFANLPIPVRAVVYGSCIAFLMLMTPTAPGTFIYQQF